MNKLVAGIAITSGMVLGVAACSGSDGSATADPGEVSGEITYAHWDPNLEPTLDAIIEAFQEEYPDVTVTPIVRPFAQYWTTLQTEASSDTLPDVFWMDMAYFELYAANDQLAPIDDLVESGAIDLSKYPDHLTEFFQVDGAQYAVPKDVDTNAVWINKALFEQAGVPLPSPDWTYDDFRATSKAIHDALGDQGIYGTAFYPAGQTTYWSSVFAYGGSVVTDDGQSGWEEPGGAEGLQIWADIVADGSSPTMQQLSETLADQWFLSGKAAMFPSVGGASIALVASSPNAADFVAVPLPQAERKATVSHALANVVSAQSDNLAAAQAFQAFFAGEEAQRIQAESGIILSAYEGTSDAFVQSHPDLGLQTFVDAIDYSFPYPTTRNSEAWFSEEAVIAGQALAGEITAEEATRQLSDLIDRAVASE
ncbi:sugar ABC transporter substrate-binding protein [Jiangella sp. DSM 45060]|uniref:ABC transporter substrate-binding protein n=1 Tax=Jiangella sp. DSM 45060 TaxID=1798224 RepID=UPI00087C6A06|nr:sugar ABC transporter substrate-binding protein [Jiangella sp. DSM 45060]SDS54094.1 carbohydrate ABC transporter substrate-binding protein, CUT1 family [Jiangella sp. DSM 45060]